MAIARLRPRAYIRGAARRGMPLHAVSYLILNTVAPILTPEYHCGGTARIVKEPRTFPLRWSDQGRILESFSPDFYLPDLDLFIELTTLKQSLVTKKNRKVRLLRELYPWIHIKIFYGRDFRQLALKYGLEPLTAAP